jgi:pilus assembly protein CpaF
MHRAPEPLGAVFHDDAVDEILTDGTGAMSVLRAGRAEHVRSPFADRDELAGFLFELAAASGVRLDPLRPATGGSIGGGAFRWHAVLGPVAAAGPVLALRRHRFHSLRLARFTTGDAARALQTAFEVGRPLVIAGPTGSGKTSLLAALLTERAAAERVVILEALEELPQASPHWVRLVERPPNLEGKGAVTLARLFQESLRLRPDRLVIGEVRGPEARIFAEATLTGHRGVATTMHASSRAQVLVRLRALLPSELFDELAANLVVVTMKTEPPLGIGQVLPI